jgi:hypothetical protein
MQYPKMNDKQKAKYETFVNNYVKSATYEAKSLEEGMNRNK